MRSRFASIVIARKLAALEEYNPTKGHSVSDDTTESCGLVLPISEINVRGKFADQSAVVSTTPVTTYSEWLQTQTQRQTTRGHHLAAGNIFDVTIRLCTNLLVGPAPGGRGV